MVGIKLCGSYVPFIRIDRSMIGKIWGRGSIGGERSVANNDEDPITMAVEASRSFIKGGPLDTIEGVYFATTSAPYIEKMNSTLIATALDLKREINTMDLTNSLRAGTGAMKAAFDAVGAGSMNNVLVAAADCRNGYPRSDEEQIFGDGAASLMIGKENLIATLEGTYSVSNEMIDVWRNPEDTFVKTWESRFILGEGYANHMKEAVTGLLEKSGLGPKDIAKAVLTAPNARSHMGIVKQLGFDPETQAQDPLLSAVGYCGAAQALMMLVAALEEAAPGDLLLLAAYADGADAMLFKVTDEIKNAMKQKTFKAYLDEKAMLPSYARFLSYKGLVETLPGEPFRLLPSATTSYRDRKSILRCHGSRCRKCNELAYPVQRICYSCGAKDEFDEEPISHLQGKVFTYTLDNLAGRSDDPVVVQTVAEMGPDKVRFYGMMTDCDPAEVKVGLTVDMTFRRVYEGAGMHNYFWKCRPVRNGRSE